MTTILRVSNLTKVYKGKPAINRVSFTVTPGSITGFLGPNGAGKSTTMNILLGFIGATKGTATVFGKTVTVNSPMTRRHVGFLSNSSRLDAGLTVAQEIAYYGHLAGGYDNEYVAHLTKRLQLDVSQRIGGLSTGNYQKVALVIALMERPKLLILDEPTNGLDPLVQSEFNKILMELKASGSTIFISSHILSEVQELCDEFIFIKSGTIIAHLTKADLQKKSAKTISVTVTRRNQAVLAKFLRDNHISYRIEAENLDEIFMKFYEDTK